MAHKERNALIPLPSGGLANIGSGPKSILSGMVSDALALARGTSLLAARFRIGDYEFRDPDYRQILIWAKALELEPEDFVSRLEDTPFDPSGRVVTFEVEDGSIISLEWSFDIFPITSFEWVDGLRIQKLEFKGVASAELSLHLPLLECLYCSNIKLSKLDLSKVPALKKLDCENNSLVELELSAVPALTVLCCRYNYLTKIDLSAVPALTWLRCSGNRLVELDLSAMPALNGLCCHGNQLVELDLSTVPELMWLLC